MINTPAKAGFSAIELLISMFIAAAFIGAGYQLYAVIIKDGATAQFHARASNVAYTNLRLYAAKATNPCTELAPSPTPTVPASSGLSNADIDVDTTCPYGVGDPTSKVTVTVTYGAPQEKVVHALFVTN
ncbi:MAG TPA: prepilin-type N-terminal cleavage/methylation domain-containing protein [Candidatus Saccharimonadales bacterium]|nr:prepilin-type N-terminal cleavage/methylation domain-containing protein [Candidatus Saccharimonadales bacterium]